MLPLKCTDLESVTDDAMRRVEMVEREWIIDHVPLATRPEKRRAGPSNVFRVTV